MTNNKAGDGFGVPALKYIKQVRYERNLGRAINPERDSRPTSWGKFVETRAFDLLPLEYTLTSKKRLYHPSLPMSGMPDVVKYHTVSDVKCPYSLEVFCDKLEALKDIEVYKKEFPEDYWQNISNAVLLEVNGFPIKYMEAIIYVPYESELQAIKEMASNYKGDQNEIAWIFFADNESLPYLLDGGKYKNLNVIRFEVPEGDKIAFIKRVELANTELRKKALESAFEVIAA